MNVHLGLSQRVWKTLYRERRVDAKAPMRMDLTTTYLLTTNTTTMTRDKLLFLCI